MGNKLYAGICTVVFSLQRWYKLGHFFMYCHGVCILNNDVFRSCFQMQLVDWIKSSCSVDLRYWQLPNFGLRGKWWVPMNCSPPSLFTWVYSRLTEVGTQFRKNVCLRCTAHSWPKDRWKTGMRLQWRRTLRGRRYAFEINVVYLCRLCMRMQCAEVWQLALYLYRHLTSWLRLYFLHRW
jgi:hypothetical protein